jgi:hypothetical protein
MHYLCQENLLNLDVDGEVTEKGCQRVEENMNKPKQSHQILKHSKGFKANIDYLV